MPQIWKIAAYIAGGAVAVWLTVRLALPVGLPFLLGWLLSRLAEPFARRMARRTGRGVAAFLCVSGVYLLLGTGLTLLGRLVVQQLEGLGARLPALVDSLSAPLQTLEASLLKLAAKLPPSAAAPAAEWIRRFFAGGSGLADTVSTRLLALAGDLISAVPELFLFLLTMLLSSYLFSSQQTAVEAAWNRLLPQTWRRHIRQVLRRLKGVLGGYVKAQLWLSLVTLAAVAVGLLLLGQNVLLAPVIALIDALPVFGAGTILLPWAGICLLMGQTGTAVGLILTYAVAALLRQILEPRFLGRQIGLNPLLTLVSLYAGFRLFGILGMILLPVAVILGKQLYDLNASAQ